ncbi:MAG: hypothetical protein ACK5LL_07995 [Suipraeoptans sp.]
MKESNSNNGEHVEMTEAEKELRQNYLNKHLAKLNRKHGRSKK